MMTLSLDWLALGSLSGHGVMMLAFSAIIFAVFVWDRFDLSSVSLAILILLPAMFFVFPLEGVEPRRFYAGFGHPALVTICALMILGHALVLTGALGPAARQLAWLMGRAPMLAIGVVLVGAAAASGVMNNTPVAVLLIPLLMAAMRRAGKSAGQVLMPMNGALLVGGMMTTIGTSTNLIVVAIASSMGVAAFGIFDFFLLVATASVPALLYLWFVAPLLLRHVSPPVVEEAQPVFEAELLVTEESWLNGAEVREVVKRAGSQLPLRSIRRAKGVIVPPMATAKLHIGDRLIVQDTAEKLKEYESRLKAPLHAFEEDPESDDAHVQAVAAQLIVTPVAAGGQHRARRAAGLQVPDCRHWSAQGAGGAPTCSVPACRTCASARVMCFGARPVRGAADRAARRHRAPAGRTACAAASTPFGARIADPDRRDRRGRAGRGTD